LYVTGTLLIANACSSSSGGMISSAGLYM
jgi:hypothetical protein